MTVLPLLSAAEASELGHRAEGDTCYDVFLVILCFVSVQFNFLESVHSSAWHGREPPAPPALFPVPRRARTHAGNTVFADVSGYPASKERAKPQPFLKIKCSTAASLDLVGFLAQILISGV